MSPELVAQIVKLDKALRRCSSETSRVVLMVLDAHIELIREIVKLSQERRKA